jgi:hypothetical protein
MVTFSVPRTIEATCTLVGDPLCVVALDSELLALSPALFNWAQSLFNTLAPPSAVPWKLGLSNVKPEYRMFALCPGHPSSPAQATPQRELRSRSGLDDSDAEEAIGF